MTRDELIQRLAEVSHATYMRQAHREKNVPMEDLSPEVDPHDVERALDTICELEKLGVLRPLA